MVQKRRGRFEPALALRAADPPVSNPSPQFRAFAPRFSLAKQQFTNVPRQIKSGQQRFCSLSSSNMPMIAGKGDDMLPTNRPLEAGIPKAFFSCLLTRYPAYEKMHNWLFETSFLTGNTATPGDNTGRIYGAAQSVVRATGKGENKRAMREESMNSASYDLGQVKNKFDVDGFVAIPGFLRDAELAEVKNEIDRYIKERVPEIPRADVYYDNLSDPTTLKQLSQIGLHDPYFASLIRHPKWTGPGGGTFGRQRASSGPGVVQQASAYRQANSASPRRLLFHVGAG